jgi:hypothetical protein
VRNNTDSFLQHGGEPTLSKHLSRKQVIVAGLAQSVERRTLNPVVEGSSPSFGASFLLLLFVSENYYAENYVKSSRVDFFSLVGHHFVNAKKAFVKCQF